MVKGENSRRRVAPDGGRFGWFRAADGTTLRGAYWLPSGTPARGTAVLLHGRREFIEKYFETIADLLERGFAVATLDWRGQGLSDRPLPDRHKGHVASFDLYLDDLTRFLAEVGVTLPAPLMVVAHSMGGHCALRYLHDHPGVFARAVVIAPMVGIAFTPLSRRLIRALAGGASALGSAARYAPMQGPYTEANRANEADFLSSDTARLEDEIVLCRETPDLALGGVTYGWLAAAFASIDCLESPGFAEAIGTPALVVLAGQDQVVDNTAIRAFAVRMPNVRLTEISEARHEILKERDPLRAAFWTAFDEFTG